MLIIIMSVGGRCSGGGGSRSVGEQSGPSLSSKADRRRRQPSELRLGADLALCMMQYGVACEALTVHPNGRPCSIQSVLV